MSCDDALAETICRKDLLSDIRSVIGPAEIPLYKSGISASHVFSSRKLIRNILQLPALIQTHQLIKTCSAFPTYQSPL
jgi:hypothetical protein